MGKALRWSEVWFRRGLWLVAVVFAGFLIALGSAVVDDLPKVEQRLVMEQFLDHNQARPLRMQLHKLEQQQSQIQDARDQARLQWQQARSDTQAERENFTSWIAARQATQRSEQDPQVLQRREALEQLRTQELQAQQLLQQQEQQLLDQRQQSQRLSQQLETLESAASEQLRTAQRSQSLRIFAYRLLLTVPLLVVAGWLFVRKRHTPWWPFVWGFIFFAVFAFFVELVPYMPSYGGYVRSVVGIVVTVLVGRWAIVALQRYLERQRAAEALPASTRRTQVDYDKAWAQLTQGVCPGCERKVPLSDGVTDFCPHCGIGLYEACSRCQSRKSAFAKFCFHCGASGTLHQHADGAGQDVQETQPPTTQAPAGGAPRTD